MHDHATPTLQAVLERLDGLRIAPVALAAQSRVALAVDGSARLVPGELISFGISHPCTAFDKWQVIPVVADDYTVTDLIRTYF